MINIFETSFEARERRFQIEKLYHGETVDLVGVVTTDGVPQNITGYSVSGVFQPTSMNGSPDFYELSADIVDNKVIVHWEKGKDFGENSYMVWALLTDGDNASYPIVWRLDMAYSPSYPLSALDPIPRTIDFDKYDLLNAPWLPLSDVQGIEDELSNEVLNEVASKYLPLSGGTVDGNVYINGNLSSNSILLEVPTTQIGVGAEGNHGTAIGYNAKSSAFGTAVGSAADANGDMGGGTAIGFGTEAKQAYSVAVGYLTKTETEASTAVGNSLTGNGHNSIVLGCYSKTSADNAIQLGGLYVVPSGYGDPYYQHQINNVPHSLKVMDKMVLSGDNLTLDPERIPYLSGYAKKEDIPEVPTDLSDFQNSPGYATSAYVQEYVAEHAGTPADMSACLSSAEFGNIDNLTSDVSSYSFSDIVAKLNEVIYALKRTAAPLPGTSKFYFSDSSIVETDVIGEMPSTYNSNTSLVKAVLGTNVTSIGRDAFANCSNLTAVIMPNTLTSVGRSGMQSCGVASINMPEGVTSIGQSFCADCPNLATIIVPSTVTSIAYGAFGGATGRDIGRATEITFVGKTIAQVKAMNNYNYWNYGKQNGRILHCTDGDITL